MVVKIRDPLGQRTFFFSFFFFFLLHIQVLRGQLSTSWADRPTPHHPLPPPLGKAHPTPRVVRCSGSLAFSILTTVGLGARFGFLSMSGGRGVHLGW